MYYSSILLHLLLQYNYFLLILLPNPNQPVFVAGSTEYTNCDGSATPSTSFVSNLQLILQSLSSNTTATGFFNDTKGSDPDKVYGLAMCRGDVSKPVCQECLNNSVVEIGKKCANQKIAMIWYDECLLRYSGTYFFGVVSDSVGYQASPNPNISDPKRYSQHLGVMMDELAPRAAYGPRLLFYPLMFAVNQTKVTDDQNIVGLVQCTRDLSPGNCRSCLNRHVNDIPTHFYAKDGDRVLSGSCMLRFETGVPFYRQSVAPPPPQTTGRPPPPQSSEGTIKKNPVVVVAILVPLVIVLMVVCALCICCLKRKRARESSHYTIDGDEILNEETLIMDLETIRIATNNFSDENKLGEGGFGPVYKGVLQNGEEIAVKRLAANSSQGVTELRNEVIVVAKLQHKNLVRLLGCCSQDQEMLLVYEYLPNTSLDKFLFDFEDPEKSEKLDWTTRLKIINGISLGLQYLHEESRIRVIHRDLKAGNILLDNNMNPKISDFGLAKLFDGEQTQGATSRIAGTRGYMAPEYAMQGRFSTKSDTFSFGVLVLELVTGKSSYGFQDDVAPNLLTYVSRKWREEMITHVLDRRLRGKCSMEEVLRCVHMALLCVQEDPQLRPDMSSIVLALSSSSFTLRAPSPHAWANSTSFNDGAGIFEPDSINECTESNVEFR